MTESIVAAPGTRKTMRLLLGSLAAALFLTLCLPAAGAMAAAPTPSCAAGPTTVGDTTFGTPCDDVIVAPPGVETVKGGAGDDTIVAAPVAAAAECPSGCFLGVGSQTFEGGPGNDIVFGQRGNDTLLGGEGNDQLFGGIGDDVLRGGPGNDLLAGGFGADYIDGESGDDYVHGDGTVDRIYDTGGGIDTLSFASGVTPGFEANTVSEAGFPEPLPPTADRGVFLDLSTVPETLNADNGVAALGGGVDKVEGQSFEVVIGTPFSDNIVDSGPGQTIYGGGGADIHTGSGIFVGGADGDSGDGSGIATPEPDEISAGLMTPGQGTYSQLYLTGSNSGDTVTATYADGPPASVTFALGGSSANSFSPEPPAESGCGTPTSTQLVCTLTMPLDSIVLAGLGGDDTLTAAGFPATVTTVLAGGDGSDSLNGGDASEDVLVDGPDAGTDVLNGFGGDDALLHNGGADRLYGGEGNDLFLSNSVCDGNLISGGNGRDNASWARLNDGSKKGVAADLGSGQAGRLGAGGEPSCGGGGLDSLAEIEDLEGSNFADAFFGDAGPNQLLGHEGADLYYARAGADSILANSGDADPVIDCGDDIDRALVDFAEYGDATPVNCEAVREAPPNSFQLLPDFPIPTPPPPAATVKPKPVVRDRTAPRTRILARPRAVLTTTKARARAVFSFASSESGSSFRCKLDRKPYRACVSPRAYLLKRGRHTIRIFAIDRSGNADRTPALLSLRVRRR
ncbi:MAG TPA: calcium-binding protein [Solirubrobacterales bacterium]|jgi:Ca2+-binding RTX toxin-like protein|nr:calcium-binding protein [Solirubrobacterales bacterium]